MMTRNISITRHHIEVRLLSFGLIAFLVLPILPLLCSIMIEKSSSCCFHLLLFFLLLVVFFMSLLVMLFHATVFLFTSFFGIHFSFCLCFFCLAFLLLLL